MRTHAARQIQKQRFGVVVGVVRRRNRVRPARSNLREAIVPDVPRAFLYPLAALGRKARHVPLEHRKPQAARRAERAHELLVPRRLRAADAVVHMHGVQA